MPYVLKNSFTRGVLSKKAQSRVDLELYAAGVEELSNYIVLPQGGIRRRSGSKFAGLTKNQSERSRAVDFVYSADESYTLEFGNQYIRFWTLGGQVVTGTTKTISGITKADPAVVTSTAHGYSNGDQVFISGVVGMTEVNGRRFTVANVTSNTYELSGVDSSGYGTYTSGGETDKPVEIATGYALADLDRMQFLQSGRVLYIVHPDYPPRKLTRVSATSWTIADVLFFDGPYDDIHDGDTTVASSGGTLSVGNSRTLTFSATDGINSDNGFTSDDVGRHIRVRGADGWAWCQVTAVTNTTTVTVEVKRVGVGESDVVDAGAATDTKSWRLGLFGTTPGYPGSAAFFEGRLAYARTETRKLTVGHSRPGLPDDFGPSDADSTVTEDHGFVRHILASRADEILWLHETTGSLLIGTEAGIRSIGSPNNSENFGPNNARQRLEIHYGTDTTVPVNAGSNTLVGGRYGKSIRDVFFDFNVNSLVAPNISLLSDHLLKGKIREWKYAQEPDSIVWVSCEDGTMFGLTYDKSERIVGYHPHDVTGEVESISVTPGTDRDVVWMQVKRTINGETVRYFEYFEAQFDEEDGVQADAFFVDSGLTYEGAATNVLTGLWHLEGEEVRILGDGAVLPNRTVANGQITLANGREVEKAHVGLQETSTAVLLQPPLNLNDGPTISRRQRVVSVLVRVLNSLGLKVGTPHNTTLEPLDHRVPSDLMGSAPALRNGSFSRPVRDANDNGGRVKLEITDPLPSYIAHVNALIEPSSSE